MAKGGYALDAKAGGFGLITLPYHATAAHSDPITDNLYLVLDENNEPTDELLPVASTAVVPDGLTIYQFDGDDASLMVFRWKGKLNLLPAPGAFQFARVRAYDYTNLVIRVYADGAEIDAYRVVNNKLTRIPALEDHDDYEIELIGTSTTRTGLLTTDAEEIE